MARKKIEKTESYRAKDVSDGSVHVIDVYTEFVDATTLSDTVQKWTPGMKSHKMASNGNHVNVNSDGTLVDIHTNRVMRRI